MLEIPVWSIILYDFAGSPVLDISNFVELNLILKLNTTSTLSFSLDLIQFEKLCKNVGLLPRNVMYPLQTEIKIYRNNVALFGGIISNVISSLQEDSAVISVTADSYIHYFSKRLINKNYVNIERSAIAWDAIETAQAVPYGDLGVTQGVLATTYNSDCTSDYNDVKSIIQRYTYAQPVTYDYEITPDKVFNTFNRLGSNKPEIRLVYPDNVESIEIPRSGDTTYNKVIGIGSGIGDERLQVIMQHIPSSINNRLYETKKLYNSVSEIETLNQNTLGYLQESVNPLVIPKMHTNGTFLNISEVFVGDSITVKVIDSEYNSDVDLLLRIYELDISVDKNIKEKIAVNFYKPDSGGELET
jgi:hypothetical protein